jgi:hypothetical protein
MHFDCFNAGLIRLVIQIKISFFIEDPTKSFRETFLLKNSQSIHLKNSLILAKKLFQNTSIFVVVDKYRKKFEIPKKCLLNI